MLSHLQEIFGSRTKALEVLYLLKDAKPIVRQGFYPHELAKVEKFCERNHLFIEKSPYKVLLHDKEIFTNKGKIVAPSNPLGMVLVYMCKNHFKALWACLYETRQDHLNTGILLGYPSCCVEFFMKEFEKSNVNPVHKPTSMWTNLTLREQDIVLLSHFPCSSDCAKSIEIAKKNFEIVKKYDDRMAEMFSNKLSV